MKKSVFFFAFLLILQNTSFAQTYDYVKDSVDKFVNEAMQMWQLPALAVGVVKDGKVIFTKGYGTRAVGKNEKVDENTLFMIASNSKAFTATALCMLETNKQISLEDKIVKFFPDFKLFDEATTQQVTVRDMLCHRIGLKTFQGDFTYWGSKLSRKEIMQKIGLNMPIYDFRTRYGYCNAGFLTAGEVIPKVTGKAWEEFVRDSIVKPLKMSNTLMLSKDALSATNIAIPYTIYEGKLTQLPYNQIDALAPAGSMISSVKDVSNWLLTQLDTGKFEGKQVIAKQAILKTWEGNTIISTRKSATRPMQFSLYGLGWGVQDYAGRKLMEHTGGAEGFVTSTCFLPEEKLGVVVLTNTDQNGAYLSLRYQIVNMMLKLPYKNFNQLYGKADMEALKEENERIAQERTKVAQKNKTELPLASYTGTYKHKVYGKIDIKLEKDRLNIYFEQHPTLIGKLETQGGNNFLCTYSSPTYGIHALPFKVENGKVKSVAVKVNDFIEYDAYIFEKE
jgi:CubicO group peptidase (beta-lactamase class C family)